MPLFQLFFNGISVQRMFTRCMAFIHVVSIRLHSLNNNIINVIFKHIASFILYFNL